jgi:hypothetical protein
LQGKKTLSVIFSYIIEHPRRCFFFLFSLCLLGGWITTLIAASKTALTFYMLHKSKNIQLIDLTLYRKPPETSPAVSLSCTLCNIMHQLVSEAPLPVEMADGIKFSEARMH